MEIGSYRFEVIPDAEFWLDGGAMFGVVPRVLWERVSPPDALNRVRLNMNCVFIDTGSERILIETGIGEKWSEKETQIYGIKRERSFAESLRSVAGCGPDDITIVVNTHLHFDHAGGNTAGTRTPSSADDSSTFEKPQFPNARYLVSRSEYEHARSPHERDRASYRPENWEPLERTGQLELMPDDYEVVQGLKLQTVRGHSETMQTWRLDAGGQTVYGFADLIPTRHHISPAWIMGYDLFPNETLAFKRRILPEAVAGNWLCLFYHDAEMPLACLAENDGRITSSPI